MTAIRRALHPQRRTVRWALTLLVTAGLLALVLRSVSPSELVETLGSVSFGLLLLGALGAFAFIAIRAWRYRLLLGADRAPRFGPLLAITLASWGVSLILPGPSGDGAFVWMARSRHRIPISVTAGAVIIARLLDVASLLVIALVTATLADVAVPKVAIWAAVGLALLIGAGLLALYRQRPRSLIFGWLGAVPMARPLFDRLLPALHELGESSQPLRLVAVTLALRLATAIQYFLLFAAIGQPLSFWQVWFVLSVRTLLLAFPIQGVGGFGTSQLWWTGALTLLGWQFDDALAASLAVHVLDLVVSLPQAAVGAAFVYVRRARREADVPAEAATQRC